MESDHVATLKLKEALKAEEVKGAKDGAQTVSASIPPAGKVKDEAFKAEVDAAVQEKADIKIIKKTIEIKKVEIKKPETVKAAPVKAAPVNNSTTALTSAKNSTSNATAKAALPQVVNTTSNTTVKAQIAAPKEEKKNTTALSKEAVKNTT